MTRIYLITNKNNGKVYVGKTSKPIDVRWAEHCKIRNYSRIANTYIYRALRKHGTDAFTIEQIDEHENDVEGAELEKKYILQYRSYLAEFGYNTTMGGEGVVPNEVTRAKISKGNTGKKLTEEHRRKISEVQRGRKRGPYSAERRAAISRSLKGRKMPPEQRAKLIGRPGSNLGKKFTEEHKRRMGESIKKSLKEYYKNHPEYLEALRERNRKFKGYRHTPEAKAKIAAASRAMWARKAARSERDAEAINKRDPSAVLPALESRQVS